MLNFILVKSMKLLNSQIFEEFSESLLSNDIKVVEKNYAFLKNELAGIQANEELKHISNLIGKVEEEFKHVNRLYNRLRKRRNALAHINQKKNFVDIKEDLQKLIVEVEELFNQGVLSRIVILYTININFMRTKGRDMALPLRGSIGCRDFLTYATCRGQAVS
ncbi:hypothetical protein KKC13_07185 [bacterium]|nr:hypothetical protein [bacterium]MBU1956921.1 hypothetical protein [bacterium]